MVITTGIVNGLKSEVRNNPAKNTSSLPIGGCSRCGCLPCEATLFVAGLPIGVSEDYVRTFLQEKIPNAKNVRVPINRLSKSIKGIAFVTLQSDADVNSVINQVSSLQMGGRSLKIKRGRAKSRDRARSRDRAKSRERARSPIIAFGDVNGGFNVGYRHHAAFMRSHAHSTDDEW